MRRTELAGFVARKEDDAPGFLRISFKHKALPLPGLPGGSGRCLRPQPSEILGPVVNYAIKVPTVSKPYMAFGYSNVITEGTTFVIPVIGCNHLQTRTAASFLRPVPA